MVILPIQILLFLLSTDSSLNNNEQRLWQVTSNSKIEIVGETNLNQFRCLSTDYPGLDTLIEYNNQKNGLMILEGVVTLMVSNFDCENKMITRDFKKTLREGVYPDVSIKFLKLTESTGPEKELNGIIEITITGVSRSYPISCLSKATSSYQKHFEGNKTFKLSDFDLVPPKKLFGAIRVMDTVSVKFHLRLEEI